MKRILLSLMALMILASCTPIGLAAGAGATLGIAAAREGGISSTADDIRIKALISDKWFKYDIGTFTKLNLTVNQGRVLITGIVQNPDDRVEAVRLAWQVEGVNQVINEIRVADSEGLPGYVRDQWITTRLRTVLTFDRDVQSINYSIDTVAGTVYLMGVAQSQTELNKVIETARTVPNVAQVISYVKMAGEETNRYSKGGYQPPVNAASPSSYQAEPIAPAPAYAPAAVESEELLWPDQ